MVVGVCGRGLSPHHGKEAEKNRQEGGRERYSIQGHTCSDLLPPTRPHQLKISAPPKIVSPAGDQAFNT
jgi:hypothetical protein